MKPSFGPLQHTICNTTARYLLAKLMPRNTNVCRIWRCSIGLFLVYWDRTAGPKTTALAVALHATFYMGEYDTILGHLAATRRLKATEHSEVL